MSEGLLLRTLERAGLAGVRERIDAGAILDAETLARVEELPLAAVCALGDAARAGARGDEVRVVAEVRRGGGGPVLVEGDGRHGSDLLRAVALARLSASSSVSVAVHGGLGLSFVEAALQAGADVVVAPGGARSLPIAGGGDLRSGLEEVARRCDRRVRWERRPAPPVERAP